ncbi:MAG TPA: ABC transporter permease [Alphaproteobacteria bacterium]|nr:ABC transporter permease [Alphaproteobacteria bacterium]
MPDSLPHPPTRTALTPTPRGYGPVNWLGLWTLIARETRRFLKVYSQTILAPAVTTLLMLAIFALSLRGSVQMIAGVPYATFLAPGLIMMAMVQNAFANTSSSLMIAKIQGSIVDSLMPPLSATELTLGFASGGVIRGLVVGLSVGVALLLFVPIDIAHPGYVIFYALAASLLLSQVGVAGAVWGEKVDHVQAVTNFVVSPLAFLSGTFYTIDRLPQPWHALALWDPFFYMIDGFRYGFIDRAEASLPLGIAVLVVANVALFALCHWMFRTGYKLRA